MAEPAAGEPYGDDIAAIHDAGFGGIARAAAALVLGLVGDPPKTLVELGCGSGISSEIFATAGHRVLGIDPSAAMLGIARRRVPAATFVQDSWRTVTLPGCDAITAIGEVVNYTDDASASETRDHIGELGRRALRALRPRGALVLDVAGPGRVPGSAATTHRSSPDWAILVDAKEDRSEGLMRRQIVAFRLANGCYRRAEEVHTLALVPPTQVAADLRALGYTVRTRRGYSAETALPGHRVIIARAPG